MAAYITQRSGNWNDDAVNASSPWFGSGLASGVPGNGDTITIANVHTLTIPAGFTATIGTDSGTDAAATPAIQPTNTVGTGILVIAGKLIYKGPIRQASATWTVAAGGIVSHGSALISYTWKVGMAFAIGPFLLLNGTAGAHVLFTKEAGCLNGGGFWTVGGADVMRITATYTDFLSWGTNALPSIWYQGGTLGYGCRLTDCTFDGCGRILVSFNIGGGAISMIRCSFINPQSTNGYGMEWTFSIGKDANGLREMKFCYFECVLVITAQSCASDTTIEDCIFMGTLTQSPWNALTSDTTAPAGAGTWERNLVYSRLSATGGGSAMPSGYLGSTIFLRSSAGGNPHFAFIASKCPTTVDGWIFEANDNSSQGGDCIQFPGGASRANHINIKNCLVLPGPTNQQAGAFINVSGNTANITTATWLTVSAEHNTFTTNPTAPIMGIGLEVNAGRAGLYTYIRDNIAWSLIAGGNVVHTNSASAAALIAGTYNGVNRNCKFQVAGDGYTDVDAAFTNPSPPGATDIVADPQFVDPTRDFLSWGKSVDPAVTTWEQIIQRMRTGVAGFTFIAAYAWIRAGFVPTNQALKNAASDGGDIGAMPVLPILAPGGSSGRRLLKRMML